MLALSMCLVAESCLVSAAILVLAVPVANRVFIGRKVFIFSAYEGIENYITFDSRISPPQTLPETRSLHDAIND